MPEPWDRLSAAASSDSTGPVIVGTVVRERRVEQTPEGYVELDYDSDAEYGDYWSIVMTEVVLAGEFPSNEIRLPLRFKEWNCGGGPRLREGDRMLLFLYQDPLLAGYPDGFVWNTELVGGQVLLQNGEAYLTDYQAPDGREHIGTAESVITRVSARVGSTPADTEAALAAASMPSPPTESPGSPALLVAALLSTGLLLGLVGSRTRQSLRHGRWLS